ncbi:glycosyltransferase [Microbacterium sp. NPDC080220]|uniref:glycosyltransferase family 2 protein n=1 Tax=Microbacterium sp. NPDC080220 TaxID=3161017 RepID=UPI0034226637
MKLSLILALHNVEGYVADCVRSIIKATDGTDAHGLEVVIVDDASQDRSLEVALDEFAGWGGSVAHIRLDENVGVGGARGRGVALARGRFLWFIDPDDELVPDAIATVIRRLGSASQSTIIEFPVIHRIDELGRTLAFADRSLATVASTRFGSSISGAEYALRLLCRRVPGVLWTKVFPASVLQAHLVSSERHSEDILTLFRILQEDCSVVQFEEVIYRYRDRATSLTRSPNYFLRNAGQYAECVELARSAPWWSPTFDWASDYFLFSRVEMPRMRALARGENEGDFRNEFRRASTAASWRSVWWWLVGAKLPFDRVGILARTFVLAKAVPSSWRLYLLYWRRNAARKG